MSVTPFFSVGSENVLGKFACSLAGDLLSSVIVFDIDGASEKLGGFASVMGDDED